MRIRVQRFLIGSAIAAVYFGSVVSAFGQELADLRVDVSLKDADMVAATRLLTEKTGLQFVIEPGDGEFARITLTLKQATAEEAIRYITQAAGATFRRDENGVFVIRRGGPVRIEVEPTPANTTTAVPRIVRKFVMRNADPRHVIMRLKGEQPSDQELSLATVNELFRHNRVNNPFPIGNPVNLQGNMPWQNSQAQATTSRFQQAEGARDIALPSEAAGQLAGPGQGGGIGGPGIGGGAGQGGGIGGGAGQGGNLQGGQGLVGPSIDFITYDPTDNSIVVRGNEEDIAALQRWISLFDVAPKQVIIKVEFVTTSNSISRSLGFDWLYERGAVFAGNRPGSFVRAGDPIFINYATGNVTTRMRTLLQEGYGRTVQAPVIRTLNNQPASIFNSITTTLFITNTVATGDQVINAVQLVQLPVVTGLSVAPRINDDGYVTVFLSIPVQDFGQIRRGPDGQEVPDVLAQQINVVARVRSGETIALGGLTRKSDTGSQSRFPVLSDLPVIGQFFRSTTRDRNNSELIIFVTPTVVEEEVGSSVGP